jgi:predicted O-linked N-acetylglucosamine transferase (SPINDLY family)
MIQNNLFQKTNLAEKILGLPENRFVFSCFNNTYKITPSAFDSWARILKSVENSVILDLLLINQQKKI